MATSTLAHTKHKGGSFLLETTAPEEVFTPEDFTEEHRAIGRTTDDFWAKDVAPHLEAIQHQEPGLAISILKKSGQLGLTGVLLPEKFGGMEMDLTSAMIVAEGVARDGSYSAWHGAHTGIGTLPLLLFGTEEQKQRYLPKLATAEMVAAYCLSEPQAGSDSLAARTRADLSADGTHYVLNGQKMWITNGGGADLYTVFAKIGGEKFTAFLVERSYPGVNPGAEEKKMGIKGSSTTAIYLDNVKVPVENVLGEIGRGHIIAFNILNLGRLKLGPFAIGGAKEVLRASLKYAKERKAFGKSIAEFGMIQHKLAEMAIRIFATESMSYRVVGLIEAELTDFSWDDPGAGQREMKAVEEYRRGMLLHQGVRLRDVRLRYRRGRADPWRLRLPSGLRRRTGLPGFADQPDLRRHQRDQPPARNRDAPEAGAAGAVAVNRSREEAPGRVAERAVAFGQRTGRGLERRGQAGRECQEDRAARAGCRGAEVHGEAGRRAGGAGGHHRDRDERVRDGVGGSTGEEVAT